MPRIPRSLLRTAFAQHPLLPILLRECRTLEQATAELRWLREHVSEKPTTRRLAELCERRGRGEPLQYILGTQPFGGLEILCRKGVLIPRPETEHLTSHLFSLLLSNVTVLPRRCLGILDLCTGTGCIPLHLYALLSAANIPAICTGIDISPAAVLLARANRRHNIATGLLSNGARTDVAFAHGDVLRPDQIHLPWTRARVDVVVANPPYISRRGFELETARSVRNYEPMLALVGGDEFYRPVARIADRLGARMVLAEVGGWEQAERVRSAWAESGRWAGVDVWPDYAGKGRGVVAWKGGWEWVRDGPTAAG